MKPVLTALLSIVVVTLLAQKDTTVFSNIKKVETNEYVLSIPEKWNNVPQLDASSKDQKYEFTDVALPHLYNNTPLTATFILRKMECEKKSEGENFLITEFTSYPDRLCPAGYNYESDSLQILSGETASLFNTHYYRRSKVSNFSRFDLVAYSSKRKTAYLLTITYQYKDPTYIIEADLKLKQYALRIFRTLLLR